MKRFVILFAAILFAANALAAQELQNKIFQVHNRDPHSIYAAVMALMSGSKDARIDFNEDLKTITVRDLPENIAVIGQAIERLDQPAPPPTTIDMKISILIGSMAPLPGASVPEELAPVLKQLQSTLRYGHYGLMTANVHRTQAGDGFEGSGVADPTLLGLPTEGKPVFYNYRLRGLSMEKESDRPTIAAKEFEFSARIPVKLDSASTYQAVGFKTPVTIRQNEKVVIGTTTLGDKALIVVVTAAPQLP